MRYGLSTDSLALLRLWWTTAWDLVWAKIAGGWIKLTWLILRSIANEITTTSWDQVRAIVAGGLISLHMAQIQITATSWDLVGAKVAGGRISRPVVHMAGRWGSDIGRVKVHGGVAP